MLLSPARIRPSSNIQKQVLEGVQVELGKKNISLAAASAEAEKLLKEISTNTAVAEKEKAKVAVIVDTVTKTAEVITLNSIRIGNVRQVSAKSLLCSKLICHVSICPYQHGGSGSSEKSTGRRYGVHEHTQGVHIQHLHLFTALSQP